MSAKTDSNKKINAAGHKFSGAFAVAIALVLALTLSGCGGGHSSPDNGEQDTTTSGPVGGGNSDGPSTPDGGGGDGGDGGGEMGSQGADPAELAANNRASIANPAMAMCAMNSDALQVTPTIPDASGPVEIAVTPGPQPAGACQNNEQFRFGSGLYDITGVVANTNGMGWESPEQVFSGLHTRQYARAFTMESPCNGKRILFVSTDTGMVFGSIRQAVLQAISQDADLAAHYQADNVMLSATHTHQGPGGYSHHEAFNLFHFGFDQLVRDTIVNGIVEAIRIAHANIEAHEETAPISLAIGELLNTNINRSLPAFEMNSEAERNEFTDANGNPIEVDKRFVQLNLVRGNASPVGVINWFGVHPTILGTDLSLVSGDHKGFASLGFEKIMATRYGPNGAQSTDGSDNFVAAFAQTDEGDASPNILIREKPFPDPERGGGVDAYDSNRIAGTKQLAKALELFSDNNAENSALSGGIDYRFMTIRFDQVEVTDQVVLASLNHPDSLDSDVKSTCTAALGVSFGAGAEDGPAAGAEGVDCADDPDAIAAAQQDFEDGMGGNIPANVAASAVLCNFDQAPAGSNLSCHAEKPILVVVGEPFNFEASTLPFQLFRIGDLAVLGLPWEVTTVAARRIRKTMLDVLAPSGVSTVVIAGLANDYVHYLTTREEYSSQQYEGASTSFGAWSLAAVQQESRKLALALRDGTPAPASVDYVDGMMLNQRTPYVASDIAPIGSSFGALLVDAPAMASRGETVTAEFQTGHPRNDLRVAGSYAIVERQNDDGSYSVIAADFSPELRFVWKPSNPQSAPMDPVATGPSTGEVQWTIPADTPAGTYRLRLEGSGQTAVAPAEAYSTVSSPFEISGSAANCSF